MELKAINRITFPAYNLLTRAESPVRLLMAAGFAPIFFTSNSRKHTFIQMNIQKT
ncbi:hypothetical protein [Leptospira noguchii]|uniref:hypothetical protein n=1 Tax=Leptospira noguchii TaxID=28182 RepID=UPI001FB74FD0|nr:hypothetical protein [Leptospira noguchii]UOG30316.1 hypothetical protein MAL06_17325 [Leptospira noguchii]